MKILILLAIFLLLGAFFIISNENLHLNNPEEMNTFSESYYSWFSNLFDNMKSITGNAIESKWLPNID